MNKWDNLPKRYIFENNEKTLFETNNFCEMQQYIKHTVGELTQYDMMITTNYIHILYYGYTLMIKK